MEIRRKGAPRVPRGPSNIIWTTPLMMLLLLRAAVGDGICTEGRPVQILAPAQGQPESLEVVEEGLRRIEVLEGPVAAIAVVGPYHSGKSFFLNTLVSSLKGELDSDAPSNVFDVGLSVDPSTRGVWAYHHRLATEGGPIDLLLFDTEGFSVANVSERYDAKVFAASTILSSLLVYNSMHLIDAKELEYLDLLAHNTQLFTLKTATRASSPPTASESATEEAPAAPAQTQPSAPFSLQDVFNLPPLLWSIQAFTLNLEGETCTSWLKRLLAGSVIGASPSSASSPASNKVGQRLGLDGLFPSVSCHPLFLPAVSRNQLHNLSAVAPRQLTQEFLSDVESVREAVLSSLRPKTRSGRPITGADFAALVRLIADGLRTGALSDIPSRWEAYGEHLQVSSVRAAVHHFETQVTLQFANATPPTAGPAMQALLTSTRHEALQLLPRLLMGLGEPAEVRARKEVDRHLKLLAKRFLSENEERVRQHLAARRDWHVSADNTTVQTFAATQLPQPKAALGSWISAREQSALRALEADLHPFRDEPRVRSEIREMQTRLARHSQKLRVRNNEELEHLLAAAEATCINRYVEELAAGVGPDPVLPKRISDVDKPATQNALTCLSETASAFQGESQYKAHKGSLLKSLKAHAVELGRSNSERLDAFCGSVRSTLVANASATFAAVAGLADELAVDAAINATTALSKTYPALVGPLRATSECIGNQVAMETEVRELQEQVRQTLTAELKAVLREPLDEICKVVLDARCSEWSFKSEMRRAVDVECTKWIRRNGGTTGASLSNASLQRVLSSFIAQDLRSCLQMVEAREQAYWQSVWTGTLLAGVGMVLLGALLHLTSSNKAPKSL